MILPVRVTRVVPLGSSMKPPIVYNGATRVFGYGFTVRGSRMVSVDPFGEASDALRCPRYGGCLNPFCASLCEEDRAMLCALSRGKIYEDGTWNGPKPFKNSSLILQKGCLVGHVKTCEGKGFGISLFCPGDIINVVRLGKRPATALRYEVDDHAAYAAGKCSLCVVSVEDFNALRAKSASLANALLNRILSQYENSVLFTTNVGLASSEERVRLFFREAKRLGVDVAGITHENLGKILGINRVTVTRAIGNVLSEVG